MEATKLSRFKRRIIIAQKRNYRRHVTMTTATRATKFGDRTFAVHNRFKNSNNMHIVEIVAYYSRTSLSTTNAFNQQNNTFWKRLLRRLVMAQKRNAFITSKNNVHITERLHRPNEKVNFHPRFNNAKLPALPIVTNTMNSQMGPINIISHSVVSIDGTVMTTTNIHQDTTNAQGPLVLKIMSSNIQNTLSATD